MQILTKNIKIRYDLAGCSQIPVIKLQVSLPDQLASVIMQFPSLDELPFFDSQAEAGVKFLNEVRKKLFHNPRVREVNQLVDIAYAFASNMKLLKHSLTKKFKRYIPFRLLFTLTVIVFVVSTVLHLLFMFVYHRFRVSERRFLNEVKEESRKIAPKPRVHVPEVHITALPALDKKLGHRFLFPQCNAFVASKKLPPLWINQSLAVVKLELFQ